MLLASMLIWHKVMNDKKGDKSFMETKPVHHIICNIWNTLRNWDTEPLDEDGCASLMLCIIRFNHNQKKK